MSPVPAAWKVLVQGLVPQAIQVALEVLGPGNKGQGHLSSFDQGVTKMRGANTPRVETLQLRNLEPKSRLQGMIPSRLVRQPC